MATYDDPYYYGTDERSGGNENDLFLYMGGDDIINGGLGTDTLSINANRSNAVVTTNSVGVTYVKVKNSVGNDSTLTLLNTERIAFLDEEILSVDPGDSGNGAISPIVSASDDAYKPG